MKLLLMFLVLLSLQGCNNTKPPVLADGRWAGYIGKQAEVCALDAMVAGKDSKQIEVMFNQCVFKKGLTI